MPERKDRQAEQSSGATIQPLETEVGKYEAVNIQRFRQPDGKVAVVFGLAVDGKPFTLEGSGSPRLWNFWLDAEPDPEKKFRLGLAFYDTPTISDPETDESIRVHPFALEWIQGELVRGEITQL